MQLSYLLPAPLEHKTNVEKEDEIICLKKKKKAYLGTDAQSSAVKDFYSTVDSHYFHFVAV